MEDKCFILKENTDAIRQKIRDAGIHVCICAGFQPEEGGEVWLNYHTRVANGVHGVGYGSGEMTGKEYLALFLYEVRNPVYAKDVDEFISLIKQSMEDASKEDSKTA